MSAASHAAATEAAAEAAARADADAWGVDEQPGYERMYADPRHVPSALELHLDELARAAGAHEADGAPPGRASRAVREDIRSAARHLCHIDIEAAAERSGVSQRAWLACLVLSKEMFADYAAVTAEYHAAKRVYDAAAQRFHARARNLEEAFSARLEREPAAAFLEREYTDDAAAKAAAEQRAAEERAAAEAAATAAVKELRTKRARH